jgi:hypothetical protein
MRYAFLFEIELRSTNQRQHWSPTSQPYAPADVLLEYLAEGWKLSPVVGRAEHCCSAGRHVDIYYFELIHDHRTIVMPVHGNPAVRRLVWERQLWIVALSSNDGLLEGEAPEAHPLQRADVEHRVVPLWDAQPASEGMA